MSETSIPIDVQIRNMALDRAVWIHGQYAQPDSPNNIQIVKTAEAFEDFLKGSFSAT